jgi:hypothetical protein
MCCQLLGRPKEEISPANGNLISVFRFLQESNGQTGLKTMIEECSILPSIHIVESVAQKNARINGSNKLRKRVEKNSIAVAPFS